MSEEQRVLTVRMPASLYQAVKDLAWQSRKSMNVLAIEVLTKAIEDNNDSAESDVRDSSQG